MSRKRSSFKATHFSIPQNYVDKIEPKGVDLSTPQMDVDKDRGVYSMNYRFNGHKAEKRWGYRKVGYVAEYDGDHQPVLCVCPFVGPNSGSKRTIAITAVFPQEMHFDGARATFSSIADAEALDATGINPKSAISAGNALYVLNGELSGIYEYQSDSITVGIESVYVPTTMTLIPPSNANPMPSEGYVYVEAPNKLITTRKNKMLTGVRTKGQWPSFQLDCGDKEISIGTSGIEIEYLGYLYYDSANDEYHECSEVSYGNGTMRVNMDGEVHTITPKLATLSGTFSDYSCDSSYEDEAKEIIRSNRAYLVGTTGYARTATELGVIEKSDGGSGIAHWYIGNKANALDADLQVYELYGFWDKETNRITLLHSYVQPFAAEPNMTVEYSLVTEEDDDDIDNCRSFCRFGHNNSLDTLWVYGNPDKPNFAWRTGKPAFPEKESDKHTYFPEDAFYKFGEPTSSIVSMQVVTESKMMVLKTKGGNDPTMYFVTPTVVTATIGTDETETEEYSVFPSNTSTAGIVPDSHGSANLNGDLLFFSADRQVAGLDIEGITGDSRRAAYTRSYFIDRELLSINPQSVKLFAFGEYLILDSDTKTYCAHRSQLNSETNQYEWWPIDNINAVSFYEDDDGNAFFFDRYGGVWLLDGHTDIDRYFVNHSTGDIAVNASGYMVTSQSIKAKVLSEPGWKFRFVEGHEAYGVIGDTDGLLEEVEVTEQGTLYRLADDAVALDRYFVDGAKVTIGSERTVSVVDLGHTEKTFLLSGSAISENLTVMVKIVGAYPIMGVKDGNGDEIDGAFAIDCDDFLSVEDPSGYYVEGEFEKETPIEAVWMSRPVPLAKFSYDKTIKQIDIYNDTTERTELSVGCVTNKQLHDYEANRVIDQGLRFDFSQIDFERLTFDKNNVPTVYHVRRFPRKQQYFSLVQRSKTEHNSVLSDMDVTYTLQGIARTKK